MNDGRALRRVRNAAILAAALLLPIDLLTGCGAGWWTPIATEATLSESAIPAPTATVDRGPVATLDVTVTDLPTLWNEMPVASDLSAALPDPLVGDDRTDGISTVVVPVGGGTLFVQWQVDDGKLLTLQLETPVDADATTSTAIPVLDALAHAGLGLKKEEASTFIGATLKDAVTNAMDPILIDWTTQSGSSDFAVSIVGGAGTFVITPTGRR